MAKKKNGLHDFQQNMINAFRDGFLNSENFKGGYDINRRGESNTVYVVTPNMDEYHYTFTQKMRSYNPFINFHPALDPSKLRCLHRDSIIIFYNERIWTSNYNMAVQQITSGRFDNIIHIDEIEAPYEMNLSELLYNARKQNEIDRHNRQQHNHFGDSINYSMGSFYNQFEQRPISKPPSKQKRKPCKNRENHVAYDEYIRLSKETTLDKNEILNRISKLYDISANEIMSHENCGEVEENDGINWDNVESYIAGGKIPGGFNFNFYDDDLPWNEFFKRPKK